MYNPDNVFLFILVQGLVLHVKQDIHLQASEHADGRALHDFKFD